MSFSSVHAGFSLAGTTITQSGTDADLSWLAGVAGVTTLSIWSWTDGRTIYSIGNRKLVVTGNLTISPESEAVYAGISSPRSVFQFTGSSNTTINGEVIENGVSRYSEALFLWSPYQSWSCCGNYGLDINNGAIFDWNGWKMRIGSSIRFQNGANITIDGGIMEQDKNSDNQLRMEDTNLIVNGFIFRGNDITFIRIPSALNLYQPQWSRWALGFSGSTPNIDFPVAWYTSNGSSDSDIRLWQWARPILTNSNTGTDLVVVPHISGNGASYGVAIVRQEVQVTLRDSEQNLVPGAKVYTRDTNNGNREVYNREGHNVNTTADIEYLQTTDASGITPLYAINLWYNIVNTGNGDAPNTWNYAWDYRGKNNDSSDIFDFNVWSYNHNFTTFQAELKSNSAIWLDAIVVGDPHISESNQSTVASYMEISNLSELYDSIKNWKTQNANITVPDIGTLPVGVSGTTLQVLNNYNVIIDAAAAQIFSVDTGTQTIRIRSSWLSCGSKFELLQLQWSGVLSLVNGGSISCPYVDFTANSLVNITTPSSSQTLRIYNSIANLNTNTSPIATLTSGPDNKTVYRYNSNPGNSIYIKAFAGASVEKGSMASYELVWWNDNILDMWSGGDFTFIEIILRQIKWFWFDSSLHSLQAWTSTWAVTITEVDKEDIVDKVELRIEESGWLMNSILNLLIDIRDRIISIKTDTQKI